MSENELKDRKKISDKFSWEEVGISCIYHYKPKSITKQVKILHRFFPGISLNVDNKITEQELPANAEGWFAIPRWQSVAKTYNEAVQKVLNLIENQREGKFEFYGEKIFRQHERTVKNLKKLASQQNGYDILIVAAQFGLKHGGRSVRRAREVFTANEFGLGTFEIGCMLLTHPKRFKRSKDLWIHCAGDECFYPNDTPSFYYGSKLEFDGGGPSAVSISEAYTFYGSPSGLLP